jgi:hypothetical protein
MLSAAKHLLFLTKKKQILLPRLRDQDDTIGAFSAACSKTGFSGDEVC